MKTTLISLICCFFSALNVNARPVLIVNLDNDIDVLKKEELVGLFMGHFTTFPDGNKAVVIDQDSSSTIKKEFYQLLTHRSICQINTYRARMLFTGRTVPPIELEDSSKILKEVRKNPYAIAYIDSKNVNNTVKVIFSFN